MVGRHGASLFSDWRRAVLIEKNIREKSSAYCAWIARLPCIACLAEGVYKTGVHVAHLRMGSLAHGKEMTGLATKPSDRPWTLGICPEHHTNGPKAQHNFPGGEEAFWSALGVDPFQLCLDLSSAYGRAKPGAPIIARHAALARQQRSNP